MKNSRIFWIIVLMYCIVKWALITFSFYQQAGGVEGMHEVASSTIDNVLIFSLYYVASILIASTAIALSFVNIIALLVCVFASGSGFEDFSWFIFPLPKLLETFNNSLNKGL